jgi:DNA-binding MarR family transcriptional regulator
MRLTSKKENRDSVTADLPLSTLLSQVLVAFTIEFDNEAERQIQHRTTNPRSRNNSPRGLWLVSMVMWSNCMRFVGEKGISVRELENLARTKTNLNGMERWGYVVVEPDPDDSRAKPPRSDWIIRATPAGLKAREVWLPLFETIEKRWQGRFGKNNIARLQESLRSVVGQIDINLPDCLPILGYGLFCKNPDQHRREVESRDGSYPDLPLSALLSRVLLAFAIEFERESDLSLAISANVLRVLDEEGMRIRDLPPLTGVSKESISMAMGILKKKRLAVVEPDKIGARAKVARLTPAGRDAKDAYRQMLSAIEKRWNARSSSKTIPALRKLLEQLVGDSSLKRSPLIEGLKPYPDGWRASNRQPGTLPHFPMVLHRGGFPDGS